jgi:hypothetical protein
MSAIASGVGGIAGPWDDRTSMHLSGKSRAHRAHSHERLGMRRVRRAAQAAVIGMTVATTIVATGGIALAAVPTNDAFGGRTVVGTLPFSQSLDTSEATTDADDAALNTQCGAPVTDASVWYEVTASADGALVADVSGSSYSAGAIVATGSPSSFVVVACAPGAVAWTTTAGQTYSVLVFDDQFDGGGNGGVLDLTIDVAPPPPTVDATVNRTATFNAKTGAVTLTGTVTCSGQTDFAFLDVALSQNVGRFTISGFTGTGIDCDGVTRPWTLDVLGDNGKFAGGKAASVTFAVACGAFQCGIDFEETVIQAMGGKK